MGEIVEFRKPEITIEGSAICIQCRHEWVAEAPKGVNALECPKCHTHKGLWKFPYEPAQGVMRRVCNCENDLFYILLDGHMCANCGTYQDY
jgi:hypothetical protein